MDDMAQRAIGLIRTGTAWRHGHPVGEQELLREHLAYLGQLARAGDVVQAGPVLSLQDRPDAEGLIGLVLYGVGPDRARTLAAQDPAVTGGLVRCEVWPWYPEAVPVP